MIIGIDSGPAESAFATMNDDGAIVDKNIFENSEFCKSLRFWIAGNYSTKVFIESIESYGVIAGRSVFETCYTIGRIIECCNIHMTPYVLLPRREIKLHICGSARANDSNIREALIARFGEPGSKKTPGATYGFKSHCWAALAVACTGYDRMQIKNGVAA